MTMKLMKRAGYYKNSTGTNAYYPDKEMAISYGWWIYLKRINGKLVVNCTRYSPTTAKHIDDVMSMLDIWKRQDVLYINWPDDIRVVSSLDDINGVISEFEYNIKTKLEKLNNPRRKKSLDDVRKAQLKSVQNKLDFFKKAKQQGY